MQDAQDKQDISSIDGRHCKPISVWKPVRREVRSRVLEMQSRLMEDGHISVLYAHPLRKLSFGMLLLFGRACQCWRKHA